MQRVNASDPEGRDGKGRMISGQRQGRRDRAKGVWAANIGKSDVGFTQRREQMQSHVQRERQGPR